MLLSIVLFASLEPATYLVRLGILATTLRLHLAYRYNQVCVEDIQEHGVLRNYWVSPAPQIS